MGIILIMVGQLPLPTFKDQNVFLKKKNITIINSLIEKSLENKPLKTLSFPSKKNFIHGNKNKVQFYSEKEIEVDYSKPTSKVYDQLHKIYEDEKIGFINADHSTTEYCYDFHLDQLSSDKFEVYKESLVKDVDWYAAYYAKYHTDSKEIKEKTVLEEQRKWMDDWRSRQSLSKEMKRKF